MRRTESKGEGMRPTGEDKRQRQRNGQRKDGKEGVMKDIGKGRAKARNIKKRRGKEWKEREDGGNDKERRQEKMARE